MKTIGKLNLQSSLFNKQTGDIALAKNRLIDKDFKCSMIEGGQTLEFSTDTMNPIWTGLILGTIPCDNCVVHIMKIINRFAIVRVTNETYEMCLFTSHISISDFEVTEGAWKRNIKGDLIIAFWNGVQELSNPARIINLDSMPFELDGDKEILPTVNNTAAELSELTLFAYSYQDVNYTVSTNSNTGNLKSGKYSFAISYLLDDEELPTGIPSNSYTVEDILFKDNSIVESDFGGSNWTPSTDYYVASFITMNRINKDEDYINKSLTIDISNLDTRYTYFNLHILLRNSGAISTYKVKKLKIASDTYKFYLSDLTDYEDISYSETLQDYFKPTKIQSAQSLKNRLYVGGFKDEEDYNFQPFANGIKVVGQYVQSEVVIAGYPTGSTMVPTFMPNEVYDFRVHLVWKNGSMSRGFFIPGRNPLDVYPTFVPPIYENHFMNDPECLSRISDIDMPCYTGMENYNRMKLFHVHNPNWTVDDPVSKMSYWENETGTYNDWLDENKKIYSVDGNGLIVDTNTTIADINDRIKLHKFLPIEMGLEHCAVNTINYVCYPKFENICIPAELKDRIQGVVFSYSKKNSDDSHVLFHSNGFLNHPGTTLGGTLYDSIGVTPFDNLTNENAIACEYILNVGKCGRDNVEAPPGYHYVNSIDKTQSWLNFHGIKSSSYVPSNNSSFTPSNYFGQKYLKLELNNEIASVQNEGSWNSDPAKDIVYGGGRYYGIDTHYYGTRTYPQFIGYSSNLDIHNKLEEVELVRCSHIYFTNYPQYIFNTGTDVIKGDCTLNLSTTMLSMYGYDGGSYNAYLSWTIFCMPTYNRLSPAMRTLTDGNGASEWKYFFNLSRIYNFNHHNVNYETRVLDDLKMKLSNIFSKVLISFNEYMVIRSDVYDIDLLGVGWRKFTPLTSKGFPNFLTTDLDKGGILHLEVTNTTMFIQTKKTLYKAGIQQKLTSQITLNESDVFDLTPSEICFSKYDTIECLHKTACRVTPIGYVVVSKPKKRIYLINDDIKDITNEFVQDFISGYLDKLNYRSLINNNVSIVYDEEYNRCLINLIYDNEDTMIPSIPIIGGRSTGTFLPIGVSLYAPILNSYILVMIDNEIYRAKVKSLEGTLYVDTDTAVRIETLTYLPKAIGFSYVRGIGFISYHSSNFNYLYSFLSKIKGVYNTDFLGMTYELNDFKSIGKYAGFEEKQQFFMDVVFNFSEAPSNVTFQDFTYRLEVSDASGNRLYNEGLNQHLVYNDVQCSEYKVPESFINTLNGVAFNVYSEWIVNDFKDKVIDINKKFMDALGTLTNVDPDMVWFDQSTFIGRVIVLRLGMDMETMNENIRKVKLLDVNISIFNHIR